MPRSRPHHIRTRAARLPLRETQRVIDGLSASALSEINRLELDRNYLQPGDISAALRLWQGYVRRPERDLWHDYEWGHVHEDCCGDPFEARTLLDTVVQALSPGSARQLRRVISRSDALWNRTSPPYLTD
ncbi:hypothetical protein [Streptomyces tanashiensis]|uniref:hypothetical protein n=1 Tax=Streptomyces tanashiensis TaxID=67367 RepID=UPI0019CB8106|nr:hypothetical protein [Streptomyces tanashiensis]GGY17178.1 hypothetical protein GCM10010299_22930 [Streptomyces tanashiensis]